MVYKKKFKELELSALGMGCMRLPCIDGDDARPDQEQVNKMVDYAIANGINYFDTAYGYHEGKSMEVIGKALARHPRESFYLANKFPGYDLENFGHHEEIFEEQLKACGVDYFDFYLFHNVCEMNIEQYINDEYGLVEYLLEQKKLGRIRHLGFSDHSGYECFARFLDKYKDIVEFCQIHLHYLDFEFQGARFKVEHLNSMGMPIWVMEGLRGGKLAQSCLGAEKNLSRSNPEFTPANWAFGFLQSIDGVTMILSGMSNQEQLEQNVEFFQKETRISEEDMAELFIAAHFDSFGKNGTVPCTSCKYCVSHCSQELNIPSLLSLYNQATYTPDDFIAPMAIAGLEDEEKPSACIGCGECAKVCPQKIDIPGTMKKFSELLAKSDC